MLFKGPETPKQVGLALGVLLDYTRIFQATLHLVLGGVWPTEGAYELLFPNK